MEINYNKLYPYPVLTPYSDDYTDCSFTTIIEKNLDGYSLNVKVSILNTNDELKEMVVKGEVDYLIHIECPQTSFRSIVRFDTDEIKVNIPSKKVNGKVNVCTFAIAKKKLENYTNKFLNSDYLDMSFEIEKGSILAVAKQVDLNVDKTQDDLSKIPSIFSILKLSDQSTRSVKVDVEGHKIKIWLTENQFSNYQKITNKSNLLTATHSIVILPVLQYALSQIKENGFSEYESYNWSKAIKKAFKKLKIGDLEDADFEINPFEMSQILIDMPIERGLNSLSNINEMEEFDA